MKNCLLLLLRMRMRIACYYYYIYIYYLYAFSEACISRYLQVYRVILPRIGIVSYPLEFVSGI